MTLAGSKAMWVTIVIVAIVAPHFTAQPIDKRQKGSTSTLDLLRPIADDVIQNDRQSRQTAIKSGKRVATTPKWGFFGTIFNLIVQQINDTKSAYTQISDLVNGQFTDDSISTVAPVEINGTTETPKISRTEFLQILDRNLKGLNRLRNLEWREAKKDSAANLRAYKDEIFNAKKSRNRR